MTYKLKEHVTDEMLKAVGFRNVLDYQIRAIRFNAESYSNTFIDKNNHIMTWGKEHIQDLIELGYVEEVD
jgi:hypothetical protein